jgi:hypothetical protein
MYGSADGFDIQFKKKKKLEILFKALSGINIQIDFFWLRGRHQKVWLRNQIALSINRGIVAIPAVFSLSY